MTSNGLVIKSEDDENAMILIPKQTTLKHRVKIKNEQFMDFLSNLL